MGAPVPSAVQRPQERIRGGLEPERVFGRRLEALVTYLHAVHHLSYGRLQRVLEALTGAVPLTWVSDLWSAQLKAPGKQYQICHVHQLRDLQYAIDAERSAWAYRMQQLL